MSYYELIVELENLMTMIQKETKLIRARINEIKTGSNSLVEAIENIPNSKRKAESEYDYVDIKF